MRAIAGVTAYMRIPLFIPISIIATSMISDATALPYALSMVSSAFALGFSGFSVHLQAFSFMPSKAQRRKYLLMKLLAGFLASFFALTVSLLI